MERPKASQWMVVVFVRLSYNRVRSCFVMYVWRVRQEKHYRSTGKNFVWGAVFNARLVYLAA